jgi:hypothetical protein
MCVSHTLTTPSPLADTICSVIKKTKLQMPSLAKQTKKPNHVVGHHVEFHNRARVTETVADACINIQCHTNNAAIEDRGVQRRVQQRVPHEDVVVKARAGNVVLLQDVLKPIHAFGA